MATSAQPIGGTTKIAFHERKERSLWIDAWYRLTRNKAAVASLFVIGFFILVALFARWIAPYNPVVQTSNNSMRRPAWVEDPNPAFAGRPEHLFGTDALGRDIFSQLVYGSRVSLIVGLIPTTIVTLIGVTVGLVSGFSTRAVDNVMMRFTDVISAFPDTLFVIILVVAFRDTWVGQALNGLLLVFTALAVISWPGTARLVRGQVLSLKEKEFIEAARAIGVPTRTILFRHLLPNTLAPIIVSVAFGIPGAIISEAFLTFIGVGLRPSVDTSNPLPTSWGQMLLDGYNNVSSGPWMLLFPVVCVGLLTLAFTFLGDGLRDALDPRNQ